MLTRIFLDDGSIDSREYSSNYIYFDGTNKNLERQIINIIRSEDYKTVQKRDLLKRLCEESITYKDNKH